MKAVRNQIYHIECQIFKKIRRKLFNFAELTKRLDDGIVVPSRTNIIGPLLNVMRVRFPNGSN